MLEEIAKFSGKLRENGIPASIRSTEIACQAVPLIKDNNGDLREALACIYLKDQRQRKRFNEIYGSFFERKGTETENQTVKTQSKPVNHRQVKSALNTASSPAGTNNIPGLNSTFQAWDHRMNHINDSIMDKIKIEYIENTLGGSSDDAINDNSGLLKSNIMTLNSLQPELIDLCQKLGRKIATKRARRYKLSKKQKPDIRRTIRKNLKHGGTLLELVKSKPKLKKQNHYFLNDVSVSCDWISIWFFCMVYAAQNSFTRARAFEFDNKTAEITSALYELNVVDAFVKVLKIRHENAMIHGKSNMYTAFESFLDQANLNSKSYVMILSDCRDWAGPKHENEPLSAEFIRQMSQTAKRVLILNPEPKNKWNVADSRVSYYEKAGAEVFEVRDLEQLANLISEI
ncbi:VWA domain-containing protein [Methanobacterium sp.]|uniref:VWA domain-containing protein n=1 Tax=Methanobacterium sp. TaxID=2164 RepID=UPI003C78B052